MLPLTGTRILDISDEATVFAARLLADLGADVIRVESAAGDSVRRRPPYVDGESGVERGLSHLLYNAGKRSLALDFDHPASPGVIAKILPRCDIVVAPLEQHPTFATLLLPVSLQSLAPRTGVVDCVFRRTAPVERATDLIGTAAGGLLYLNGYREDPPNHPAGQLAYKQVSLAAALASVSMLLEQSVSGAGGRITISMQEAVMWTTIQSANENYWYWHRTRQERQGLANLGGQTIFEAAQGGWVSFYQHPPAWPAFVAWVADVLGEHRFEDPEWEDQLYRLQHFDEITDVTASLCRTLDRDSLVDDAQGRGILVVPVQSVADIASDPHLRERSFFQETWVQQLGRDIEVYRPPFVSTAYEIRARSAPRLGEHSRKVLTQLAGFRDAEVDELTADHVILPADGGVEAR